MYLFEAKREVYEVKVQDGVGEDLRQLCSALLELTHDLAKDGRRLVHGR